MNSVLQGPLKRLDYSVDWAEFLGADTVEGSVWSISPAAGFVPVPVLSGMNLTGAVASVYVSALAYGKIYELTNRATTSQGRVEERSFTIRCA